MHWTLCSCWNGVAVAFMHLIVWRQFSRKSAEIWGKLYIAVENIWLTSLTWGIHFVMFFAACCGLTGTWETAGRCCCCCSCCLRCIKTVEWVNECCSMFTADFYGPSTNVSVIHGASKTFCNFSYYNSSCVFMVWFLWAASLRTFEQICVYFVVFLEFTGKLF